MKRILILLLSLILVFNLVGCRKTDGPKDQNSSLPVEDKQVNEDEIDNSKEEDIEADIEKDQDKEGEDEGQEESDSKWPQGFMDQAPRLEGNISIAKEEGPHKYFLKYKDMDQDQAKTYVQEVKDAGFTKNVNDYSNSNVVKYKGMDSSNNLIIFHWNKNGIAKLELIKK